MINHKIAVSIPASVDIEILFEDNSYEKASFGSGGYKSHEIGPQNRLKTIKKITVGGIDLESPDKEQVSLIFSNLTIIQCWEKNVNPIGMVKVVEIYENSIPGYTQKGNWLIGRKKPIGNLTPYARFTTGASPIKLIPVAGFNNVFKLENPIIDLFEPDSRKMLKEKRIDLKYSASGSTITFVKLYYTKQLKSPKDGDNILKPDFAVLAMEIKED